jgi:hypothetical protein
MVSLWFFQPHYRLERLLFNSYYHVEVEMDKTWYGKVGFLTSECPDVDTRTYTKCPSLSSNKSANRNLYDEGDGGKSFSFQLSEFCQILVQCY